MALWGSLQVKFGLSYIAVIAAVLLQKKDKAKTLYCVTPDCTYTFKKDDEE